MGSPDLLFGLPQPARCRVQRAALLAVLVVAALLRFDGLGEPSLWLDEILHVEQARSAAAEIGEASWAEWPAALSIDRENGALYYAGQILALSLIQDEARVELAARIVPAISGVLSVAALFLVVLEAGRSQGVALVAAALLAVAPLHVVYSREGRPYAAVMLATTVMLLLAFRPRRRWVVPAIYLLAAATACLGAVAAPVLASFVMVAAVTWWLRRHPPHGPWPRRRDVHVAVACGLALLLMALLFPTVPGLSHVTGTATEAPDHGTDLSFAGPLSLRTFDRLLTSLTTSGLDSSTASWLSFVVLALALSGAVRWALHDPLAAARLAGLSALPIAGWLVLLHHFDHWYNVRYTSAALPAFLALVAYGLVDAARSLGALSARTFRRLHPATLPSAILSGGLLVVLVPSWAASRAEPWLKPDWRGVADLIAVLGSPDEPVIARDDWAAACLRFYSRRHGTDVRRVSFDLAAAEELRRRHPQGWVAAAGYREGRWFDPFLHRLDPVLRLRQANVRLLRYPDFASIRWSSLPPRDGEHLADLLARFGETPSRQDFGPSEALLGAGWSAAETDPAGMTFRWAASTRAEMAIVVPRDPSLPRALRLRAMPFPGADRPPQTMSVRIDGELLTAATLEPGWNELTLPAYDSSGPADLVTFDFAWTQSPRDLDPASGDGRSLAVAFDFVESVPAASVPAPGAKATPGEPVR